MKSPKRLTIVDVSTSVLTITGFTGNLESVRKKVSEQYFFVNGRSVKNTTVMAAFESAYKNSVMVGKFPGGILFITLPPELVDVNVHPSKIEVRFSDERAIFDAVYHSVKSALNESTALKQAVLPEKKPTFNDFIAKPQQDFKQTTVQENIAFTEKVLKPLSETPFVVNDVKTEYSAETDRRTGPGRLCRGQRRERQ